MWLFTTSGFVSIVEQRGHPDRLLVRGRVRADLEPLAAQVGASVHLDPNADYGYRFTAPRDQIAQAVARRVAAIDYPSFNEAVARHQGRDREEAYREVWASLRRTLPPLDEG
jgi:hypothetical protein